MNNKEIEIKLLFRNKNKIIDKLKPKIKFLKEVEVLDKYFVPHGSQIKNKNNFLRIRKINNVSELTYKGRSENKKRIKTKTELTSIVSSPEIIETILKKLGLKKISEHSSKKEYWFFDDIEIVFVKFIKPAKLTFMEIEASSEKKIENILKKIDGCVSKMKEKDFNIFDKINRKTN
jgi:predicted adenylyl cyclase CyaB